MRVLIAEDNALVREGLVALIEPEAGWEVVGHAATLSELFRALAETIPDLVVLDLHLGRVHLAEHIRELRVLCPAVRLVGISALAGPESIPSGLDAFVSKSDLADVLMPVLRAQTPPGRAPSGRPAAARLRAQAGLDLAAVETSVGKSDWNSAQEASHRLRNMLDLLRAELARKSADDLHLALSRQDRAGVSCALERLRMELAGFR